MNKVKTFHEWLIYGDHLGESEHADHVGWLATWTEKARVTWPDDEAGQEEVLQELMADEYITLEQAEEVKEALEYAIHDYDMYVAWRS